MQRESILYHIQPPTDSADVLPADLITGNRWVDLKHPHWQAHIDTWKFIEAHYSGKALKLARDKALHLQQQGSTSQALMSPSTAFDQEMFLWRRVSTESYDQFLERAFVSRYPRVMAAIVDEFAGSLIGVESKDVRTYDDIWEGQPEDEDSKLFNYWKNADGSNTPFLSLIRQQAGRFVRLKRVWFIQQTEYTIFPHITDVVNWREENGRLVEVLVREHTDKRKSIKERHQPTERYLLYTLKGFERYEVEEKDGKRIIHYLPEESGDWDFPHYATVERDPDDLILPIDYVDLEVDGFPGDDMAEGANYLFNLLSDARIALRQNNYPYWVGDVDNEAFKESVDAVRKGWNMLQGKWTNEGPNPDNAKMAFEVYKQEVEEYFRTMHQMLEASTADRTATEITMQEHRGRRTFLATLAEAMQQLENKIWFLYAQKQFPDKPEVWNGTKVKRTDDFAPINSTEWAERLAERYFGQNAIIPVGAQGKLDAARKIGTLDGVNFNEDELEAAVKSEEQGADAARQQPVLENERLRIVNQNESDQAAIAARTSAIAGTNGQ